jgi:opacity protein-like surface antigen
VLLGCVEVLARCGNLNSSRRIPLNRFALSGLLCAGLGAGLPAFAGTWSVGVDVGTARMNSSETRFLGLQVAPSGFYDTTFDSSVGLRVDYWITPHYAIEAGTARTDGSIRVTSEPVEYRTRNRDMTSLRLGARGQWTLGERAFFLVRAGINRGSISYNDIVVSFAYSVPPEVVDFPNAHADYGAYVGLGLGWQWNEHWSSSLDINRAFGDSAFGCRDLRCDLTHSSRFDTATVGLEYRFE